MNPFDQIAATLSGRQAWPFAPKVANDPRPVSKTEIMRVFLRRHGSASSATLADEADVPGHGLVGALLKGDIAKGSVFHRDGRYHWNPQFDADLHRQLMDAKALLTRHGYEVLKVSTT